MPDKGHITNDFGLTDAEMDYCHHYFKTKNKTRSYMAAYNCTWENACKQGWREHKKPQVLAYIKNMMDNMRNDSILSAEEVLVNLSEMAVGKDDNLPKHQKVYGKERVKALELLAKHYALLVEVTKGEISHKVAIVDDIAELDDETDPLDTETTETGGGDSGTC